MKNTNSICWRHKNCHQFLVSGGRNSFYFFDCLLDGKQFTLPEESSFYLSIGHPIAAVCIRTSTERPEALEAGDFILAGITTKELLNATDMAIKMKQDGVLGKPCPDYVDETVSMKVVRIIQGYVNVVNKMVWRKDQK